MKLCSNRKSSLIEQYENWRDARGPVGNINSGARNVERPDSYFSNQATCLQHGQCSRNNQQGWWKSPTTYSGKFRRQFSEDSKKIYCLLHNLNLFLPHFCGETVYTFFFVNCQPMLWLLKTSFKCKTPGWQVSPIRWYIVFTLVANVILFLICYESRGQLNKTQTYWLLVKEVAHAESKGSFPCALFIHIFSWASAQRLLSKCGKWKRIPWLAGI